MIIQHGKQMSKLLFSYKDDVHFPLSTVSIFCIILFTFSRIKEKERERERFQSLAGLCLLREKVGLKQQGGRKEALY